MNDYEELKQQLETLKEHFDPLNREHCIALLYMHYCNRVFFNEKDPTIEDIIIGLIERISEVPDGNRMEPREMMEGSDPRLGPGPCNCPPPPGGMMFRDPPPDPFIDAYMTLKMRKTV